MNLEFGILWFEDAFNPGEVDSIREAASNSGFEASIRNSADGSNLAELAQEQAVYHPFDLILLDLNLAGGVKGDALAPQVRKLFRSTPILFYSGSVEEADLRRRMADERIEGIFCAHRRRFLDRAAEMISDLAQSLDRLSGMRGLAVEVVAVADSLCKDIVLAISAQGLADGADKKLSAQVVQSAQRIVEDFPRLDGLTAQLDHRAVDSMKLFGTFRDLLRVAIREKEDGEEKDHLSAMQLATKNFRAEVLEKRNILGHATEFKSKDGWEIRNSNGDTIMTTHDFPALRRHFLSNLKAIREIHHLLVPQQAE
ncbi:response regulator [Stappia sp. WLB 29]|uniref:response regulator n=1 Tax=Stappia sp. WLB 29 TaxID=2925220 RepID=UPI0020C11348|nr:response regulator [Stappia sp. WLB 29]